MDRAKFQKYLEDSTYVLGGATKRYTSAAIQKRLSSLAKLEAIKGFDIDSIIFSSKDVADLLDYIREKKLENPAHQPLSNALRHYYTCQTGKKI